MASAALQLPGLSSPEARIERLAVSRALLSPRQGRSEGPRALRRLQLSCQVGDLVEGAVVTGGFSRWNCDARAGCRRDR